jgi:hypothetical protein
MSDFPTRVLSAPKSIHARGTPGLLVPNTSYRQFNPQLSEGTVSTAKDFQAPAEIAENSAHLPSGKRAINVIKRGRKYETAPLSETRGTLVSSGRRPILTRSGNQDYAQVGVRGGMWAGMSDGDPVPVEASKPKSNVLMVAAGVVGAAWLLGYLGRR